MAEPHNPYRMPAMESARSTGLVRMAKLLAISNAWYNWCSRWTTASIA